jgi:pyruvate dehydrogenase E1 component
LLLASTIPACQAYDPAFAYEVAAIIRNGINRMYGEAPEDVFYYITLYNENYVMPPAPQLADLEQRIVAGLYKWQASNTSGKKATILFSGSAHTAAREAAAVLEADYGIAADLWSATSYKRLREDALETERWNRLHPTQPKRTPLVTNLLADSDGPIVAVSDFMRAVPEQVARFLPNRDFVALGTDGMGRSDTRESLRKHFEINAGHVVVAVLSALSNAGHVEAKVVADAITRFAIDTESVAPWVD